MVANEGCVSVSGSSGNLLFYSDSVNVWNAAGTPINPTTPLNGDPSTSVTQAAIAVPNPDPLHPNQYYLFVNGPGTFGNGLEKLWYTIVDTSTGVPVLSSINTLVTLPSSGVNSINEQLTAVPNCDGSGYWVIVSHSAGLPVFYAYAYSLTASSVSGPVTSTINPFPAYSVYGNLKASPDGTMLALASSPPSGMGTAVFNFDRSSGILTLRNMLSHDVYNYGCSFSPNSKLLYIAGANTVPGTTGTIYQYDMTAANPDATGMLVGTVPSINSISFGLNSVTLQLGPDQKIYSCYDGNNVGVLPVITFPNQLNTTAHPNACGFTLNGPSLAGKLGLTGLPNMIDAVPPTTATPLINCQSNITVDCNDTNGAIVNYGPVTATSSPCCPGGVPNPPICSPASGSLFPIGVTPVSCTVVDACGYSNTCTFTVTVQGKGGHEWQCARRDGGTGAESGNAIAVDKLGNFYVVGNYTSPSVFGTALPGYGGGENIYVAKYDGLCNLSWMVTAGSSLDSLADIAHGIAVDTDGNIYMTGEFQGSCTFGTTTLNSSGLKDCFVAKYDASGVLQWAKSFGGTGNDIGMGIAVDGAGDCYVAGEFQGSFTIVNAIGTTPLTSSGAKDCIVVKYNSSGAVIWAAQSSATSGSLAGARAVAVDASGNAYVTGVFQGTVNFGFHSVVRPGFATVFVSKCGPSGFWFWATHSGNSTASGDHDGRGIGVDANGFCYVTAYFNGTADFGLYPVSGKPVAATNYKDVTPAGQLYDYLVAKFLTSSGAPIWAVHGAGPLDADEEPRGLAVDVTGNCYITGFLQPGATTPFIGSGQNVLVAKYNSDGVPQWNSNPSGSSTATDNIGWGIAVDGAGCAYIAGAFTNSLSFLGLSTLNEAGGSDAFVAKLCPNCGPLVSCPADPMLTIKQVGGNIVVTWIGPGHLEFTDFFKSGIWYFASATSPYTIPFFVRGDEAYFRVVCP